MRTYSGFILFEEVLDFAPTTDPTLYQFVQDVIRPRVRVLTDDCLTKIGKQIDVNYEIEGWTELATDVIINKARIDTLLANSIYKVAIRNLNSCTQVNGICRKCFAGTYIDAAIPDIGQFIRLEPEYNYQTDVVQGNGYLTVFGLTENPEDYTKTIVIINGITQTSGYTISGTTLTMNVAPSINTNVVIRYYKTTAQPYVGYLAESYTGSLMGMRGLPTQTINIRPSLAQSLFSEEALNIVTTHLRITYKDYITDDYSNYIESIADKLERAIYIAMLYGLYANVTI